VCRRAPPGRGALGEAQASSCRARVAQQRAPPSPPRPLLAASRAGQGGAGSGCAAQPTASPLGCGWLRRGHNAAAASSAPLRACAINNFLRAPSGRPGVAAASSCRRCVALPERRGAAAATGPKAATDREFAGHCLVRPAHCARDIGGGRQRGLRVCQRAGEAIWHWSYACGLQTIASCPFSCRCTDCTGLGDGRCAGIERGIQRRGVFTGSWQAGDSVAKAS
jgi:hypothetical protein